MICGGQIIFVCIHTQSKRKHTNPGHEQSCGLIAIVELDTDDENNGEELQITRQGRKRKHHS